MRQNLKNSGNDANGLMRQLVAEKKKGIMALCLIALMAFMWVRVLGRKTPKNAAAEVTRHETTEDKSNSESLPNISFIELPNVKGLNDVLTGDFFAADDWQDFIRDEKGYVVGIEKGGIVSEDGLKEVIERAAEKLKLQAIVMGKNPQAFINDKLLSTGDKLLVGDGVNTYQCKVVRIEETQVFIRCQEAEITLKLTREPDYVP